MKRGLIPAVFMICLAACAHLPQIQPDVSSATAQQVRRCRTLFPQGRWQLYHAIEATVPGGTKTTLTGVSVLSSETHNVEWALMTIEGLVLFSGRYDGTLTVRRALAPFDRPGFAQGLVDDLRLLFFTPQAPLSVTGRGVQGGHVCRFGTPAQATDIVVKDDGSWEARQYDDGQRLVRSLKAENITLVAGHRFAKHLMLKNHGLLGYQLELRLLEAVALQ